MRHTLIADSGSTKCDWALDGKIFSTHGLNPIHLSDDAILSVLKEELLPHITIGDEPIEVNFYGSGVIASQEERVKHLLTEALAGNVVSIFVGSDLLGAARALLGHKEGIACILGTGSNSCLYDGHSIVANTPPLGFILGDEGSGAVLGRRFLNALYKGALPSSLREEFEVETGMTMPDVINRVYRQPLPARWLASLSPFVHSHLHHPGVEAIVVDGFRQFLRINITPYGRPDLPVNAVGSIAHHYRPQMEQAAKEEGFTIGTIARSPIERLLLPL